MRLNKCILIMYSICLIACQTNTSKQDSSTTGYLKHQTVPDSDTENTLKLVYTGNMGVCLEYDDKTVIIDGLHEYYDKPYVYPPETMVNQLIKGEFKDFSKIEFCLFTHLHGDHFSGKYAKQYLESSDEAYVIGSSQLMKDVVTLHTKLDSMSSRFFPVPYNKKAHSFNATGIKIEAIQCDHTNPKRHNKTENIAYLVNLGGYNILHVGDTDWSLTREPVKTLDIKNKTLDIAILPYWLLLDDSDISQVNDLLAPKHIIATHIPPDFSKRDQKELRERFSNITLLMQLGEVHYFEK
ncbi:MBL fold metallo-hydrolase [uncultured Psychroserpens sp.]|uniref:MBL fold metallo-hydrolase n=1 Tax=uncultured Psychroserpens sp. TaxID=255436 RepID=UPI0026168218|nr:MBL fold metallo-hydrolase [uncultured Psychroserpens sp.]